MLPWQICELNLREAMRCYACATEDGETREVQGVTITSSGVNFGVFNSAMLTAPITAGISELERKIVIPNVHFAARGLDWSCWFCDDMLPPGVRNSIRSVLSRYGLQLAASPPGMYADRLNPVTRKLPHLEIRPVGDDQTRYDFCDVASSVFMLPFPIAKEIYGAQAMWQSTMTGYVGYYCGKPASIVTTVIGPEAIGIYSLATVPNLQQQGCGEAMLRHAMLQASRRTGLQTSVLQTTKAGFALYERLGYQVVTRFAMYVREG